MRAAHSAEDAAGESVAGERGQQLALAREGRACTYALYNVGGITVDVALLAEQGCRLVAGIECYAYDFGAFGYEEALFGIEPVAQLCLG